MNETMFEPACAREDEVLDMLAARQWPGGGDADLTTHVERCETCRDLVVVATALVDDHQSAWTAARVPPPALVWWRAQTKAREEAARAAARPIAFAQGIAAASAVWLVVSLLRSSHWQGTFDWRGWGSRVAESIPDVHATAGVIPGGLTFLIVVGGSLALAPLALLIVVGAVLREE